MLDFKGNFGIVAYEILISGGMILALTLYPATGQYHTTLPNPEDECQTIGYHSF